MKTLTTFRLTLMILLLTAPWVQAQGPGDHWSFQPLDAVSPPRAVQPAAARCGQDRSGLQATSMEGHRQLPEITNAVDGAQVRVVLVFRVPAGP